MNKMNERTEDDVIEMLHLAKLSEEDVLPASQVVYFTDSNLYDNNFKLLELDTHLLQYVAEGKKLYIKGDNDENVVICTDNRTYDVVETETSNSLLLMKDMKFHKDLKDIKEKKLTKITVHNIFHEYLEVIHGKPHLKKLHKLLQQSVYKGPEYESDINKDKIVTLKYLQEVVQASDAELIEALDSMDVVVINNAVRLLDLEYHFRVLSYMLKLVDENSWELDEINYEETIKSLEAIVPAGILDTLFDKYTEESKVIDGLQLYKYQEHKVCQFFFFFLLSSAGKFNLNEFLQAWRESVPEGMVPEEEMLYGIALIDRKSNPNVISAFSEEDLPDNINERLKVLFEMKEKWTVPEIAPYIKGLTTEKLDVNALLAKYARGFKINGVKHYSAKHAK